MTEMDKVKHARSRRILTFGVFCNRIADYKGRIPKRVINELEGFRLSLTAMLDDEDLRIIAANRLEVLELLLDYCATFNAGETQKAEQIRDRAVVLHKIGDKIIEEVLGDGF
jgi:hypothetical protein